MIFKDYFIFSYGGILVLSFLLKKNGFFEKDSNSEDSTDLVETDDYIISITKK